MAHAFARDAVFESLDLDRLAKQIGEVHPVMTIHSQAADRHQYLQRPDLGRKLDEQSLQQVGSIHGNYDVCINVADGLSATAINRHALPLLEILIPRLKEMGYRMSPVSLIQQGRVAISDETGMKMGARVSIILIGERPGLSSPDSLGVYLTYGPMVGNTDEKRNCISNIGPAGLQYEAATEKIVYLIAESMRLQLSGVSLKDNTGLLT